ncbi:MAG: pectate lyase, partial [Verrucomicrobiaceae bacterium]|nr:pectate lyase [Verrucomicrobiaceae bacterium]
SAAVFEGDANAFFKDNEGYDWEGKPLPLLRVPFATAEKPPLWPEGLIATSTTAALWDVARSVGARPGDRDAIDQRIITQALTGKARIIDSQDDVGGYPKIEPVTRALEVPATRTA